MDGAFADDLLLPEPFFPETVLGKEASTTRAKEMPEVDPRKRESEAPWTDTMPMLDTSLSSFSDSCRL